MAVCDFNLDARGFYLNLMNHQLYNSMNYEEDIYDIIRSGNWTLERMNEMIRDAAYNEVGESRVFGFATSRHQLWQFYYGCNELLLAERASGQFTLEYDMEKTANMAESVYKILIGDQTLVTEWWNSSFTGSDAWRLFSSGQVLVQTFDLGAFGYLIHDLPFETAFVPNPKYNSEQEKYVSICGSGFVGIPVDVKDPECCSLILEALNQHSYNNFRKVYLDNYFSYTLAQNPNDYEILNMLLENTVYDLGFQLDQQGVTTGKALNMFQTVILENRSTNVTSYIRSNLESCLKAFEEQIANIY